MPPLLLISSVPALSSGKKTTEATVRGRTAQEKRGRETKVNSLPTRGVQLVNKYLSVVLLDMIDFIKIAITIGNKGA